MLSRIPTYILFRRINGDIMDIVTPCFEDEIEEYFTIYFQSDLTTERLKEEIFKEIYSEEYIREKTIFWVDYIEVLLTSLVGVDIDDLNINDEDESLESSILCIFREKETLVVYFGVECNLLLSALLTLEITKYFEGIFEIDIRGVYYLSKTEEGTRIFIGNEAFNQQLLEQIKNNKN